MQNTHFKVCGPCITQPIHDLPSSCKDIQKLTHSEPIGSLYDSTSKGNWKKLLHLQMLSQALYTGEALLVINLLVNGRGLLQLPNLLTPGHMTSQR